MNVQISAFDLDCTLVNCNCSFRFGVYLCKKRLVPFSALFFIYFCYLSHFLGFLSLAKMHEKAFRKLFYGLPEEKVKKWAESFLKISLNKLLYKPAYEKLKLAQAEGQVTAILSSSPDFIVELIAKRLNVSYWIATRYAVDVDNLFCRISHTVLSKDKVKFIDQLCVQLGSDRNSVTAYSDSYLDLPFLLAAGKAVGVNPDKKLAAFCRQYFWQII